MNACINTVFTSFELNAEAFLSHETSSIGKSSNDGISAHIPVSSDIRRDRSTFLPFSNGIDLETLAGSKGEEGALWNVELKRSRGLEPTHCTFRLPPVIIGNKYLICNGVASIRRSGTVHVLGSGSVKGVLELAKKVRDVLFTHLVKNISEETEYSNFISASKISSRKTEKRNRTTMEEEDQLWVTATKFCRELEHPCPFLQSTESEVDCEKPQKDEDGVFPTSGSLFTSPSVLFARVTVYPVKKELRRLRELLLHEQTVGSLSESSSENKHFPSLCKNDCRPLQSSYDFSPNFSSFESSKNIGETFSIHSEQTSSRFISPPLHLERRASFKSRRNRSSTFFLNVIGEEAVEWISRFVGVRSQERNLQEDERYLISMCPPSRVNPSFIRKKISAVLHRIYHGHVQRLSKQKGIQIQLYCKGAVDKKSEMCTGGKGNLFSTSDSCNTSLSKTFSEKWDSYSYFTVDSVALDYSSSYYSHREVPKLSAGLAVQEAENEGLIKVDCTIFTSGMGTIVSKSLDAVQFVIREVVLTLILVHADF